MAKEKKKILIVEDEDYIREMYAEVLRDEGYEIEEADEGKKGLKKIMNGGYDLILLDVILPYIDGFDIMKKVTKDEPKKPNGGILFLTNLSEDVAIDEGIELGAKGYLVKSDFTPGEVVEKINSYFK